MSTLRNTVQRRNHRERAQPKERQKWGLLEKAKDYKLRAADHKVKKRKLKALQQKARDRNEDEFYFAMMSSQSQGGVKVAKRGQDNSGGGGVLKGDVVKLMKTQDVGYLRTMLQQTRKERERLDQEVVSAAVGVQTDVHSVSRRRKVLDTTDEDVPENADQVNAWESSEEGDNDPNLGTDVQVTALEKKRRKLEAMRDREQDLAAALQEVETQRAKMNGGVGGVNSRGVKFKVRQRKR